MKALSPFLFFFLAVMLTRCRSEQVTFQGQPEAQVVLHQQEAAQPPESSSAAAVPATFPLIARQGCQRLRASAGTPPPSPDKRKRRQPPPAGRFAGAATAVASYRQPASKKDKPSGWYTFMAIAGVGLMIGAVVLGFLIGGWAGLGIGLLLLYTGALVHLMGIYMNGGLP